MLQLDIQHLIVHAHNIIDYALFRNHVYSVDNEVFDIVALHELACHSVTDTSEHFTELLQIDNIRIILVKFL